MPDLDDLAGVLTQAVAVASPVATPEAGPSTSCHPTQSALEKTWGSTLWGMYPFFLVAPFAWLAALASAGEAAGLSVRYWTGGGLPRKVRKTSAMLGGLGAWLRTHVH